MNKMSERASDIEYMSDPMKWVTFLCPVKRYNKDRMPEFAYLVGDGPNLYHGNMFAAKPTDRKESFKSYDAIVDAGWVVD